MTRYRVAGLHPVDTPTGQVAAPGETVTCDPKDPHTVALVDAGHLVPDPVKKAPRRAAEKENTA
jgi:hypothetical protein